MVYSNTIDLAEFHDTVEQSRWRATLQRTIFKKREIKRIDILRAALFTNTPVSIPNWEPVFEEMQLQTVAALPYHVLPDDAVQWRSYCLRQQGQFARVKYAQNQLISLLEGSHIPCVIQKGAAAAMYYPYPNFRTMGDVDFLVKRRDLKKI